LLQKEPPEFIHLNWGPKFTRFESSW